MTGLAALWLPIIVSAVFVFVVSSIVHMAMPWHKSDYPKVPGEDKVRAALGPLAIPPGEYMVPRCEKRAEMSTPEFREKLTQGPVVMLTVYPNGIPKMGKMLAQWFLYVLIVSVFAAYIAGRALGPGTMYLHVFRFAGATAFIGYVVALWQMSIWYGRSWSMTFKYTFDGLIYALLTAGTFGWLWPR
ncbi:MAG: hypothetical protein U0167_17400 [bacterium]